MPSPRIEKKRERTRREILRAARAILDQDGLEAVTLASVAASLDVTKQALYHYFPSKDALARHLVASLIDDEVDTLIAAVEEVNSGEKPLGALIRAFYGHYIDNLDQFRAVYCQLQLYAGNDQHMDEQTLRNEINPRTKHLFDRLEEKLAGRAPDPVKRARLRRLAFTAWTSALGLMTILGVSDALNDPLVHEDDALLDTLAAVFDESAAAESR